MAHLEQQEISALVVLRPASGMQIDDSVSITSENLTQFEPSVEDAVTAVRMMEQLGFGSGPVVGISFSISGSVELFENTFAIRLRVDKRGGVECVLEDGTGQLQVPLDRLSQELQAKIHTITFTPPLDFGPF